jgi:RNA polymerase sigma factor (sigma-70 family)
MIELSDERLAQHGAQGDQRAFEAIYRRYHQDLFRFCLGMLGNPHDAQDTLQNTMVKVLRALPGEKRSIKLKPWLYRIARNEAVETLRRHRDRVEPEPEQAAPTAAQIAERVEARERLRKLFADLEQLPDRQRGALVMRELSGLSFEEIGDAFETTPATARQTVYEARLSLQQMEEGREMRCEVVTRALSEADGRSRRRRGLQAHLRDCAACRAFAEEIDQRRTEFAALAPLPLAASAGILQGIVAGQANSAIAGGAAAGGATGGGSLGAAAGGGAGKAIATSAIAKSAATVAVVAVAGVSVAGRAGLVDVPLAGRGGRTDDAAVKRGADPRARVTTEPNAVEVRHGRDQRARFIVNHRARSTVAPTKPGGGYAGLPPHETGRQGASAGGRDVVPSPAQTGRPSRSASGDPSRGRSRGKQGKAPKGPAAASKHGQQTAAAHRSPQANPSPAGGPRSTKPSRSQAPSPPVPTKTPAGQAKGPPNERGPESSQQGPIEQPANGDHGPDGGGGDPFKP